MRFALSAVAATSGVFLLGLAFYGQPALYLQQVRDEVSHLFAGPGAEQIAADAPIEPDRDAVNERMVALQQQVARLRDELAARQALDAQPAAPPRPKPDAAPQPAPAEPFQAGPAAPAPPKPGASIALTAQLPLAATAPPAVAPPAAAAARQAEAPKLDWLAPSTAAGSIPPAIVTPPRHEPVAAEPTPPKPEQPKPEVVKPEVVKPEVVKTEPPRPEPARPEPPRQEPARIESFKTVAQKAAIAKPPPAPPSQPSPPRQDIDDTQSVLARLRQIAPATEQRAEPPASAELKLPEPKPPLPPSPSLPKLSLARAALAAGRIDDARRLLQETQLQLVFRPVNATGDEQPSAGRGAADVAHALEALSANNIPLSRRYIDIASDDLSGNRTNQPVQVPEVRTTGYAPAYPPR